MAETTEAPLWNENEPAKVESWRLHVLLEAGYPVHLAERLAGSEVDLHDAVELVTRGCDHSTAAEILLSRRRGRGKPRPYVGRLPCARGQDRAGLLR